MDPQEHSNLPGQGGDVSDVFVFPVSFPQRRLWFLDRLLHGNWVFNLIYGWRISGKLDITALEKSILEIVRRHEILRTTFEFEDNEPMQVVAEPKPFSLPVVDLRALSAPARECRVLNLMEEESAYVFNLAEWPLQRLSLLRLADDEHVLVKNIHNIISDCWSEEVFMKELVLLYPAFSQNKKLMLPELPIQYADFSEWQRQTLHGNELEKQFSYWKEKLAGLSTLQLPTDHPRPATADYSGGAVKFSLSPQVFTALKTLSKQENVTLFITLLAAFKIFLHRCTGQQDIVVGTLITNRSRAELDNLIGPFLNTLVLRTELQEHSDFLQVLRSVRDTTLGAFVHQDLPFETLVDKLRPDHDPSQHPLCNVMFIMLRAGDESRRCDGITITPLEAPKNRIKFDLVLSLLEKDNVIEGEFNYSTVLFDRESIERMTGYFLTLLDGIVADTAHPIGKLPILSRPEKGDMRIDLKKAEPPSSVTVERKFVAPRNSLEQQLAAIWSRVLGRERMGVTDNFFELGYDSLMAMALYTEIEKKMGRKLPLATLFQAPTVEQLAAVIQQEGWTAPWSPLVPIQPLGENAPFFCIHGADGAVLFYSKLAALLAPNQPVYGLQAQGLDGGKIRHSTMEAMASFYIGEIRKVQTKGPYFLGGFSFGGLLALEIAQQLRARGEQVALIVLFDATNPAVPARRYTLRERIAIRTRSIKGWSLQRKLAYIWDRGIRKLTVIVLLKKEALKRIVYRFNSRYQKVIPPNYRILHVREANIEAALHYRPTVYSGTLTIIRAENPNDGFEFDSELGWGGMATDGIEIHDIAGEHETMFHEPHVQKLARTIRTCIEKARLRHCD
jgi:thioesterase domain-containing protein/acyl carrier protein